MTGISEDSLIRPLHVIGSPMDGSSASGAPVPFGHWVMEGEVDMPKVVDEVLHKHSMQAERAGLKARGEL